MDEGWWSGVRYPTIKAVGTGAPSAEMILKAVGTGAIVAGMLMKKVADTVAFAEIPHIRLPDLRIHFGTNS